MKFEKMHNGNIVVVHKVDEQKGILYGWNLNSPNLRIKSYRLAIFEKEWKWNLDYKPILLALHDSNFYSFEDCKYHKSGVTRKRYNQIMDIFTDW